MKKSFTFLTSILLAISLTACGNSSTSAPASNGGTSTPASTNASATTSASKVTMTISTPDPDTASITVAAKQFAKVVGEKSNGSIEIKVSPNGSLYGGDPSAAVKQLGAGSLDMLALSSSLYANFVPKFNVISVPYIFDDTTQLLSYLNGEPGQELLKSLDTMNILGLGFLSRNFRQITNSKKPIQAPKDLEGLRLRVPNNPLWVEFFKATGAVPTPMAFGEVYNALQLKTIDGQENPAEIPLNSKFYEVQKYLSVSNHMADGWIIGINKAKFAKLSPEQQKVITEATKELQTWSSNKDKEDESKSIEMLKEKKMEVNTLTAEQRGAFVQISKQLTPKFKELVKDDAFYDKTLKFVGKDK
jgi:tripartite ATP-independent transporter DctP family solute receptor